MVAALTRILGPAQLDLVEDVVQEALLTALRKWPFMGVPANPTAWLVEVARNRALDALRRSRQLRDKEAEITRWCAPSTTAEPPAAAAARLESWDDDLLPMMFLCCHPVLPRETQVALTLKTVGGFSVPEIARAFLAAEPTIAQRLVRGKAQLREQAPALAVPPPAELPERLDAVLDVLYLMFNEGYSACQGQELIRRDLVDEALRLTQLLLRQPRTAVPKVDALLALFLFQAARLPARVGSDGELLLLEHQDRTLWESAMIQRGFAHLRRAASGTELSTYHLQAGIASCHARAATPEETDWRSILAWYDLLVRRDPSPIVRLNRAVAVAMVHGPLAALEDLDPLCQDRALQRYSLLPATRGEMLRRLGRHAEAADCFVAAAELAGTEPERQHLRRRWRECCERS